MSVQNEMEIRLEAGNASSLRVKRGTTVRCSSGILWVTASGEDIILREGEELVWDRGMEKLALYSLFSNVVVEVHDGAAHLQDFHINREQALSHAMSV